MIVSLIKLLSQQLSAYSISFLYAWTLMVQAFLIFAPFDFLFVVYVCSLHNPITAKDGPGCRTGAEIIS
ncbi:hypothetical protein [Spirosoma endophyticum]|uniref:hypothetical protein n=1 Tax=Spirosoma endophyticum TaxID=662367 RepID=UPI00116049DE|nr:hypothetical protein [Spirosoma endophyticum]